MPVVSFLLHFRFHRVSNYRAKNLTNSRDVYLIPVWYFIVSFLRSLVRFAIEFSFSGVILTKKRTISCRKSHLFLILFQCHCVFQSDHILVPTKFPKILEFKMHKKKNGNWTNRSAIFVIYIRTPVRRSLDF